VLPTETIIDDVISSLNNDNQSGIKAPPSHWIWLTWTQTNMTGGGSGSGHY